MIIIMAKTLPYFKFYASEWNDGDITIYGLETQGLFINICSLYWSKEGELSRRFIECRFPNMIEKLDQLIAENVINLKHTLNGDFLKIRFLDEQMGLVDARSLTSRINGQKGGRPPKPKKPNHNLTKPNIDKTIEEKEKYIKRKPNQKSIEIRKLEFFDLVFSEARKGTNKLPDDEIKNFIDYWTECGVNDKKMRYEKEKSFGISRRLGTWVRNYHKRNPPKEEHIPF